MYVEFVISVNDLAVVALLQEFLVKLLPDSSPPLGGTLTVYSIVLLALGALVSWVWKAYDEQIKAFIRNLLGSWPRRIFLGAWFVFTIFAAGYVGSNIMLWAAFITIPTIAFMRLKWRLPLTLVAAISLAVMGGAWSYETHNQSVAWEANRVLCVLSFENETGTLNDKQEVQQSWSNCEHVFSDVFGNLGWLKIHPRTAQPSDYDKYVWGLTKEERHLENILYQRNPPHVLLQTSVLIGGNKDSEKIVVVTPELRALPSTNADLEPVKHQPGRPEDRAYYLRDNKYISLVLASWLWSWLKEEYHTKLGKSDDENVNQRILNLYSKYLYDMERMPSKPQSLPPGLVQDVDNYLRHSPSPDSATVIKLLSRYPMVPHDDQLAETDQDARRLGLRKSGMTGSKQ
jgi:hypothetical protein